MLKGNRRSLDYSSGDGMEPCLLRGCVGFLKLLDLHPPQPRVKMLCV